jgi:hypothetical protein
MVYPHMPPNIISGLTTETILGIGKVEHRIIPLTTILQITPLCNQPLFPRQEIPPVLFVGIIH